MNRRDFLQQTAVAAAATTLAACVRTPAGSTRPNIVLIMADDLGYGDLGVTGRKDYNTPVLDALARSGVQLTQAYASAPVCTPTRVALMTGRYPARNPIGLYEPLTTQPAGLATRPRTLSRLLRDAGYETALVGKWHLGLLPQFHPLEHGFDEFFGFAGAAADYRSHIDTESLQHEFYDGNQRVQVEGYLTELFSDRAVQIASRKHDRPFFLNLQYNAPHWPWQGPGDPVLPDSLRWVKGGSPEIFARMMESLDSGVGRVLAALHQSGLDQNTLVVFTSDNGGERFSHMGPFSQSKMRLFEGGIRVAAMARWPDRIRPGTSTDQVAATMDWTATFLRLAGAQADADAPLDGIDLMPALTGGGSVDRDLYWRVFQRLQQKALRSGDWKYLKAEQGEFLFDLSSDVGERNNLAPARPEVFGRLKAMVEAWEKQVLPPIPLDPRYT
jgi:arylsulfatase A-like enzyme